MDMIVRLNVNEHKDDNGDKDDIEYGMILYIDIIL